MPAFGGSCGLQQFGILSISTTREGPAVYPRADAESLWSKMGPGPVKGCGLTDSGVFSTIVPK